MESFSIQSVSEQQIALGSVSPSPYQFYSPSPNLTEQDEISYQSDGGDYGYDMLSYFSSSSSMTSSVGSPCVDTKGDLAQRLQMTQMTVLPAAQQQIGLSQPAPLPSPVGEPQAPLFDFQHQQQFELQQELESCEGIVFYEDLLLERRWRVQGKNAIFSGQMDILAEAAKRAEMERLVDDFEMML